MSIDELKHQINLFKKQLEIINGQFLSNHLTGFIYHDLIRYRNPDNNWFAKDYVPVLDEEASSIIGKDCKNGYYYVYGTNTYDDYIYDLINGYRIEHKDENYDEIVDNKALAEIIPVWKELIAKDYNREEHIKRYVWKLIPAFINSQNPRATESHLYMYGHYYYNLFGTEDNPELFEEIEKIANSMLSPNHHIEFSEFQSNGMVFKIIDYHKREVRIKRVNGLFGEYICYSKRKAVLPNQSRVTLPVNVYHPQYGDLYLTEVGKGVFESLTEATNIEIPKYVHKIEWSFWNCKNLSSISVNVQNPYFCDLEGVLYTKDKKILVAYPNAKGKKYIVPSGVEEIGAFAFKDCDNLEELSFPLTVKRIGINAFYRCTSLKTILCEGAENEIKFDGYCGEYGIVNPEWYYNIHLSFV